MSTLQSSATEAQRAPQRWRRPYLTTLNCGMGRDSIAMLCLLAEGRLLIEGKLCGPDAVDAVIFSDTGAEWPHTYALLPMVRAFCVKLGVRFFHLRKPPDEVWRPNVREKGSKDLPAWFHGCEALSLEERAERGYYHRRLPIREEYLRFGVIAVTSSASCTDNHKIQVMRRLLSDLSVEVFGPEANNTRWSLGVKRGELEPHRRLIGFTIDEQDRAQPPPQEKLRNQYERLVFPLIEAGLGKADEGRILRAHGFDIDLPVYKSGCYLCPFQSPGWFWALSVMHPDLFTSVEEYEATALARHKHMHVLGGRHGKPIRETVTAWRGRNPHATLESVLRKDYSRSRCRPSNEAQATMLEVLPAPPDHHLVARLERLLDEAPLDLTQRALTFDALAKELDNAGLPVAALQARDAAALARVEAQRPPPLPPTIDAQFTLL